MIQELELSWGQWRLDFAKKTYIMGILNVTPDSFSDGGRYNNLDAAVERARQMVENGADIIDVGGESTRPGFTPVSVEDEIARVVPIIEAISSSVEVPVSIDTYKAATAEAAVKAGAAIINDIWGAKYDSQMASVAAKHEVPIVLTHNRNQVDYHDFLQDVVDDLLESVDVSIQAGVPKERIILDPGIGFAKSHEQNLKLMRRLDVITSLGFPVLLGTSRKSLIANTLQTPPNDRLEGTSATISLGIERGCHIVRVHDVKEMSRTSKMMDAMLGKGKVNPVG
ncbi:dihydropteroate synthase [Geomicrobium sediminis]|uniref:Dihydropteroate synthase n=1 Tax=Geomicrobium sediminis TaxID=1347788 RepID=A0ABS2PJH3_9BACL|nr:dihydropteroate synthase [Geomicrobium sediminis]MBM7635121.1 dihydropteroate synthase [Geomicrobium sediminis]